MQVLYTTHDMLFEVNFCPECANYWVYHSCGFLSTYNTLINLTADNKPYFKCFNCGEPFWIKEPDHRICPICKYWNDWDIYQEWTEEI